MKSWFSELRWLQLKRFFKVSDPLKDPLNKENKLYKIKEILDDFIARCRANLGLWHCPHKQERAVSSCFCEELRRVSVAEESRHDLMGILWVPLLRGMVGKESCAHAHKLLLAYWQ